MCQSYDMLAESSDMFAVSYDPRYITVLVEMTKFEGTHYGKKIAAQMLDVTIRVKDVRPFAVRQMVRSALIRSGTLISDS